MKKFRGDFREILEHGFADSWIGCIGEWLLGKFGGRGTIIRNVVASNLLLEKFWKEFSEILTLGILTLQIIII